MDKKERGNKFRLVKDGKKPGKEQLKKLKKVFDVDKKLLIKDLPQETKIIFHTNRNNYYTHIVNQKANSILGSITQTNRLGKHDQISPDYSEESNSSNESEDASDFGRTVVGRILDGEPIEEVIQSFTEKEDQIKLSFLMPYLKGAVDVRNALQAKNINQQQQQIQPLSGIQQAQTINQINVQQQNGYNQNQLSPKNSIPQNNQEQKEKKILSSEDSPPGCTSKIVEAIQRAMEINKKSNHRVTKKIQKRKNGQKNSKKRKQKD